MNKFKKAITTITLSVAMAATAISAFAWDPGIIASPLSATSVKSGDTIAFTLSYIDDIKTIGLTPQAVELKGFDADVSIIACGNSRTVLLSHIKNQNNSELKRIFIHKGTALSSDDRPTHSIQTQSFRIVK